MSHPVPLLKPCAAWLVAAYLAAVAFSVSQVSAQAPLHAAPQNLWFHHLSADHGLPQSFVIAMAQDSTGYLWFGTVGGLARFDGRTVTTFQPDPNDEASLPDMTVTALTVARDGTLWVGTQSAGLARYRRDGTFERFPFATSPEDDGLPRTVQDIAEAPDGTLWIVGTGRIAHFDPITATAERFPTGPHTPHNALVAVGRTVWGMTTDALLQIDTERRTWEAIALPPARGGTRQSRSGSLVLAPTGRLWVGLSDGLLRFDPITRRFDDYRTLPRAGGLIQGVVPYGEDAILFLSPAGLTLLEPATATAPALATPLADTFGDLPASTDLAPFVSAFISREGVLWLGTNGSGLLYTDLQTSHFALFQHRADDPASLSADPIRSVTTDSATAWIGTFDGIDRLDLRTGAVTRMVELSTDRSEWPERTAWGLDLDRSGRLWALHVDRIDRRDEQTGRLLRSYAMPEGYPILNAPTFHYEDAEQRHWIGSPTFGTLDPESGDFAPVLGTPGAPVFVHRLHPATDGTLWLATNGHGLVHYDPRTGTSTSYLPVPSDSASVSSENVQCIWEGEDGVLWLGTLTGLNRFDPETERVRRYTSQNSDLPDNYINGVLGDEYGHLWISTNRGLVRFDPETERFVTYTVDRGLQSQEFNRGAYARTPDGSLLFGGMYGLSVFDPSSLMDNPVPPRIALTSLLVNGTPVHTEGRATLAEPLGPDQNTLVFQYTALHFSNPALNRFQYRLEGYDDDWSAPTNQYQVRYTNLPPDNYTFYLRAANPFGVWSEDTALLSFTIQPPVWATWWFRLGLLLAGIAALSAVSYRRSQARRRLEVELRRLVDERTAALRAEKERTEQQADALFTQSMQQRQLFTDLSHETRTPLTLILSPIEQLLDRDRTASGQPLDEETRHTLTLVQRNAHRLLNFFDQMLDLARLESGARMYQPRRFDLGEFVEGVVHAFEPLADDQGLTLTAAVPDEPLEATADPAMLEVVLFNLIGNALKFSPAGGRVHVALSATDEQVQLSVEDTGVGIGAEHLDHIFDRYERVFAHEPGTGIGLALVREIAEAHGGTVDVESTVGEGSTFTMCWPRRRDDLDVPLLADYVLRSIPEILLHTPSPSAPISPTEDSTTILIVDDNADVRRYLRDFLTPSFRVVEADNGAAGLAEARTIVPDLVVSDVRMPGLDGYELCAAIKQDPALQFVPVILLTADGASVSRIQGLETGADDFVVKPFNPPELKARIDNLLATRRAWREQLGHAAPLPLVDAFADLPAATDALRARLQEIVHDHFTDGAFSAGSFAEIAGLSPAHLRRKTQELFGHSPTELVRRYRLRQAALLLERKTGTVAEIAYSVGFNSVSYFTRTFRDLYGVVPSAYDGSPAPMRPEENQVAPSEVSVAQEEGS